jgi:hypothetical protein
MRFCAGAKNQILPLVGGPGIAHDKGRRTKPLARQVAGHRFLFTGVYDLVVGEGDFHR